MNGESLDEPIQIVGQIFRGLVAKGWIFSEALEAKQQSMVVVMQPLAWKSMVDSRCKHSWRCTGRFSQKLDLSKVAVGAHTLAVFASDAAGLTGLQSLNVQLANAIPFVIESINPLAGASDVIRKNCRSWARFIAHVV